ncbi:hypothetical protein BOW91_gp014 [Synechococcus phage S-WAM2]|uniref:Uncharacterized protein n=1 Tax=Synechococcus phage S-WAM2 TaxID=1815522 RepID=A0A1D8KSU3_9CAUD|nr:hypothetical protein BOW91_gp014 [Synechococcus phage S-WAM2]AOV61709.1 hypothetical protein P29B0810_014 [Synechococcus phage S-WAM2]
MRSGQPDPSSAGNHSASKFSRKQLCSNLFSQLPLLHPLWRPLLWQVPM